MSSTVIATAIKMLESLSETAQEEVLAHLREYITELQDERGWDARFKKSQHQLAAAARRAKEQITQGEAVPLDHGRL